MTRPAGRSDASSTTSTTRTTRQEPEPTEGTEMSHLIESVARTEQTARLGEAARLRRGHQIALARRKSRRAERAALQARLVLSRTL